MGHIFHNNFGINSLVGSTFLAIISYFIFLRNIDFVTKINSIIVPFLIVTILIIGIKNVLNINLNEIGINEHIDTSIFWIFQTIIYSSYNLILVIPVLVTLKKFIKNNNQIITISIFTGIFMAIISILTFLLLVNVDTKFENLEMPIVYVIENKFKEFRYVYGIIILISIFTTAVSVGISFLNNISKSKKSFPQIAKIMCISSIIVSKFGFSNLVKILFPLFGYLGFIQIYFILKT